MIDNGFYELTKPTTREGSAERRKRVLQHQRQTCCNADPSNFIVRDIVLSHQIRKHCQRQRADVFSVSCECHPLLSQPYGIFTSSHFVIFLIFLITAHKTSDFGTIWWWDSKYSKNPGAFQNARNGNPTSLELENMDSVREHPLQFMPNICIIVILSYRLIDEYFWKIAFYGDDANCALLKWRHML